MVGVCFVVLTARCANHGFLFGSADERPHKYPSKKHAG